jgi:hypothetical protein
MTSKDFRVAAEQHILALNDFIKNHVSNEITDEGAISQRQHLLDSLDQLQEYISATTDSDMI